MINNETTTNGFIFTADDIVSDTADGNNKSFAAEKIIKRNSRFPFAPSASSRSASS